RSPPPAARRRGGAWFSDDGETGQALVSGVTRLLVISGEPRLVVGREVWLVVGGVAGLVVGAVVFRPGAPAGARFARHQAVTRSHDPGSGPASRRSAHSPSRRADIICRTSVYPANMTGALRLSAGFPLVGGGGTRRGFPW